MFKIKFGLVISLSTTGSACLRITKVVNSLAVHDGSSSKSGLKIIGLPAGQNFPLLRSAGIFFFPGF